MKPKQFEPEQTHSDQTHSDQRHCIRLHGPWELTVTPSPSGVTDSISPTTSQRIKLPGTVGGDFMDAVRDSSGIAVFKRRFGTPTGLSPQQTIELVVDSVSHSATIKLNDRVVQPSEQQAPDLSATRSSFRGDVTDCLAQEPTRNSLEIEIALAAPISDESQHSPNEPINHAVEFGGEIRLEIISR